MLSLPESELILNPDGSVYHLGLRPEHLAPLIITVGDPARVAAVSERFDEVTLRVARREFVSHGGRFAGRPLLCVSTGIGTDNVDIVIGELDALANVDFATRRERQALRRLTFLRLGTSGAAQADLPIDSLAVTEVAIGLDGLGPHYEFPADPTADALRGAFPRWAASAYGAVGSQALVGDWVGVGARRVTTLTCAGFYGPQRRRLRLPFRGPGLRELTAWRCAGRPERRIDNFEMETAGIYALALALGHRAVSVSALLANRATGGFSEDSGAAVSGLIDAAFRRFTEQPELYWPASVGG